MDKLIAWLSNIRLRQTLIIFVFGIVFLVSTACSGGNTQASSSAKPTTPEANAYQTDLKGVDHSSGNHLSQANQEYILAAISDNLPRNRDQAAERAVENAKSAGNNQFAKPNQSTGNVLEDVREKLNLDEPLYPPTKEVLNDVGNTAKETAKGSQRVAEDTVEGARQAVDSKVKSR